MSLLEGIIDSPNNPLAVVEDIAASNNWPFERSGEDEVTIVSKGDWTDYQLSFTWMTEIEALHLACAFDMKIPPARRAEVQRLIAAINEQLWVGHFDIWTHTGMIMYRQALVLPGGIVASTAQCETMLVSAIHACERYYPAVAGPMTGSGGNPYAVSSKFKQDACGTSCVSLETPGVMGPRLRGDDAGICFR